ncbi:MAG: hypothetical protein U0941_04640 [Planctomycetaceae bacterium]
MERCQSAKAAKPAETADEGGEITDRLIGTAFCMELSFPHRKARNSAQLVGRIAPRGPWATECAAHQASDARPMLF